MPGIVLPAPHIVSASHDPVTLLVFFLHGPAAALSQLFPPEKGSRLAGVYESETSFIKGEGGCLPFEKGGNSSQSTFVVSSSSRENVPQG